jgi:DDE family transposase
MSKRHPEIISPALAGQVRHAILHLVTSHLPLGIATPRLDDELAWDILCYAAINHTTIETACQALAGAPSGNTVRAHLAAALSATSAGVVALEDQLNAALAAQLPRSIRKRLGRFRYEIAIDLVEVPYHGQPARDAAEVRRGAAKSGTTHFHMYGTLAIVHHHRRYTVAITFVWAKEKMEQVVKRLLDVALALGLRLRRAYLDKGFCSTEVMRLLRRRRVPYIIRVPQRGQAGGIRALFVEARSYRTRYTFNRQNKKAYTTDAIIVRKYSRGRYGRHGVEYFA